MTPGMTAIKMLHSHARTHRGWNTPCIKHRVVVELPKTKRTTESMETANTAWLKKNQKRKTCSTADQPRWYIWEEELMDSDEYEVLQKALNLKEADPENQLGGEDWQEQGQDWPPSLRTKTTEYDI